MIEWKSELLVRDFREFLVHRLSLSPNAYRAKEEAVDFDCHGINPEVRFIESLESRLTIRILPIPGGKSLEGLRDYIHNFVRTEKVFHDGALSFMSSRREFRKYSERLAYHEIIPQAGQPENLDSVEVVYRVEPSLLALTQEAFRSTVYDYTLMPVLDWAQRKKH